MEEGFKEKVSFEFRVEKSWSDVDVLLTLLDNSVSRAL